MHQQKDFGLIFFIHLIIVILAYSSPFWLSIEWILIGIVLNYLQILVLKGCILSQKEFSSKDILFVDYYLRKAGIHFPAKHSKFIIRYIFPAIICVTAFVWQIVLRMPVLV